MNHAVQERRYMRGGVMTDMMIPNSTGLVPAFPTGFSNRSERSSEYVVPVAMKLGQGVASLVSNLPDLVGMTMDAKQAVVTAASDASKFVTTSVLKNIFPNNVNPTGVSLQELLQIDGPTDVGFPNLLQIEGKTGALQTLAAATGKALALVQQDTPSSVEQAKKLIEAAAEKAAPMLKELMPAAADAVFALSVVGLVDLMSYAINDQMQKRIQDPEWRGRFGLGLTAAEYKARSEEEEEAETRMESWERSQARMEAESEADQLSGSFNEEPMSRRSSTATVRPPMSRRSSTATVRPPMSRRSSQKTETVQSPVSSVRTQSVTPISVITEPKIVRNNVEQSKPVPGQFTGITEPKYVRNNVEQPKPVAGQLTGITEPQFLRNTVNGAYPVQFPYGNIFQHRNTRTSSKKRKPSKKASEKRKPSKKASEKRKPSKKASEKRKPSKKASKKSRRTSSRPRSNAQRKVSKKRSRKSSRSHASKKRSRSVKSRH